MSYIGAQPTTASFPFDQFSGNGSTTAFTLTYAPASPTSIIVAISGVVQNPNLYSIIGTTLTFSPAPPTGTNNISVLYLGLPVIGVSSPGNTAYFSSTSFTATASQTTFTPSGSYTPGFINVIRNGSQLAPADYTATNGTTVVLNNACTAGDIVVIEVYTLTSISNALPLTGGTVTGASTFNAGVNLAVSSGNVGIGTSSPSAFGGTNLQVQNSSLASILWSNGTITGQLLCSSGAEVTVGSRSNHPLRFGTNDTERARIDTSGNLLVGRTNNPSSLSNSLYVTGAYSNTTPSGANVFVNTDGSFFRSTSSLKYKTDIQNYSRGLEDVAKLRAVFYKAKSGISTEQRFAGFIAEEIEAAGLTEFVQYNEDNKPDALSYGNMVALCVKAIQEQQAMIEELKAKVAALEAK
jgi:hypothetical protein